MITRPPLNRSRRRLLAASVSSVAALPAASWLLSRPVHAAWPHAAFGAKTAQDALRELFGDATIEASDRITITLPDVAEDGAVVPLTIQTDLEPVESIVVVSEKNPVPLIARFDFGADALTDTQATRIKLAESENVIVVVATRDRLYSASRYVEVLIGGCS
jgi:sulfur-oxidizing protein SoxY